MSFCNVILKFQGRGIAMTLLQYTRIVLINFFSRLFLVLISSPCDWIVWHVFLLPSGRVDLIVNRDQGLTSILSLFFKDNRGISELLNYHGLNRPPTDSFPSGYRNVRPDGTSVSSFLTTETTSVSGSVGVSAKRRFLDRTEKIVMAILTSNKPPSVPPTIPPIAPAENPDDVVWAVVWAVASCVDVGDVMVSLGPVSGVSSFPGMEPVTATYD